MGSIPTRASNKIPNKNAIKIRAKKPKNVRNCERSARSWLTLSKTAIDACRYFGGLIVGRAVLGVSKEELLSERFSPVQGYWRINPLVREIDEIAAGSFKQRKPPEIKGSGYVVEWLEAALESL